jgi:dienelactone hydrolase
VLDDQPEIVTICGSTRFRAEISAANRELTLAGYIVLAPGVFGHDGDEMTEVQKSALDELHLRKIDLAAVVYVVNPGGYIGHSTRIEIGYARRLGKRVRFLVDVDQNKAAD